VADFSGNRRIERDGIEGLLPHAGAMCLLDSVEYWNDREIRCRATSHLNPDNPLREAGRLDAVVGIEYASQAIAIHGALKSGDDKGQRAGYLGKASNVKLSCERLDQLSSPIDVIATHIAESRDGCLYAFSVRTVTDEVLSGKALIAFPR